MPAFASKRIIMKEYSLYRVSAEVDLSVIRQNLLNIKACLKNDTEIIGVVKADGYGHGALAVADAIHDLVFAFAVATVEEALDLRKAFPSKDIYILGYCPEEAYPDLIEHKIHIAVFSYSDAQKLSECAASLNMTALVNIKLDTGMGRIGFSADSESADTVFEISKLKNIEICTLFTHFSSADGRCEEDKAFTENQLEKLKDFISMCEAGGVFFKTVSASNSAAIIENPETHFDAVRAGILIYGYYPSNEVQKSISVKEAMSLKSHIVQIKEVPADFSVGYGRSYVTSAKMRIATVPVGYGDGYPRRLSNKGRVLICGEYAPIIGRICMDMFMVDITHIKDAKLHSTVTLMGCDADKKINADEIAQLTDTISYEIICDIGKRVPRKYINKP